MEFACYHVTTKDRLPNILKEGLTPDAVPSWFKNKTPYVMLSLYPYWSLYENRQAWGLSEVDKNSICLIEIKDPAIKREYFDDPEGLRWPYTIAPKYFNAIISFSVMKHGMSNEVKRYNVERLEPNFKKDTG